MASNPKRIIQFLGISFFLLRCTGVLADTSTDQNAKTISRVVNQLSQINKPYCPQEEALTDCDRKIDLFCKELYDPKNAKGAGNSDLKIGAETLALRLGTDSKDNSFTYLALSEARLKNSGYFPARFKKYLDQYGYFKKLKANLDTGKLTTLQEKRKYRNTTSESSKAWSDAFNDAIDDELNSKHPNFQALRPIPPRWNLERAEMEQKLEMDIAKATWEHTPAWGRVQTQFAEVQKAYLDELEQSDDIPKELKKLWIDRIKTVQLKIPGTESYMLDEGDCALTQRNGMYYPAKHAFTVCAGTFNTSSFLMMMSHELSHSIGESRDLHLAETQSPIAQEFGSLTRSLCERQPAGCIDSWQKIKKDFLGPQALLKPLSEYTSQASRLRACLQYHSPVPNDEKQTAVVAQAAEVRAHNRRSDLAGAGYFLDSIKATSPQINGKDAENLSYLNPCNGVKFKDEGFSFQNALPVFYLAEYQCLSSLPPEQRMAEAIKTAEAMQKTINQKTIPMGGTFSRDTTLIQNNFSNDSEERFADWMGARVMARVIATKKMDAKSKLNLVSSNLTDFCDPPSNELKYASEAQIQKEFNDEPHSLNSTRRQEILTPAIRTVLGCKLSINPTKECKF